MARTKNRFNAIAATTEGITVVGDRRYHTALYARLSVDNNTKQSNSIESQLDIMKSHVRKHPELAECYEYVDNGFTGTNFERPAFNRMMDDIRNGKINCIVVKDLSRFGRDYLETTNYIEVILPFLGVRFISVNDHFDTDNECNENKALEVALKNLVNDMYAKDVSKRLVVVRKQEIERGKFTGSNAPYGYLVDNTDPLRHYIIDEAASAVVREIYQMAVDGKSVRQISLELQERNLSIPGQYLKTGHLYQEEGDEVKVWHVGTISNILRNQAYIGNLVQGRRRSRLCDNEKRHFTDKEEWIITENTHLAIVDKKTYDKVRSIFEKKVKDSCFNSDRGKDIPMKEDKYFDLLFCGNCGRRLLMSSRIKDRGKGLVREYFYQCNATYDINNRGYCKANIMEWKLDKTVFIAMKNQVAAIAEKGDAIAFCEDAFAKKLKPLEVDIAKIKGKIAKVEYEENRRYEEYVVGDVSRDELEVFQKESAVQIKKLQNSLKEAERKYQKKEKELADILKLIKSIYKMKSRTELTRELLLLMVDKIIIYPNAFIEIQWKFTEWFSNVSEEYGKGKKS